MAGKSGLRGNRAWKLLWTGSAVSAVGDFIFDTTIVLWVGTIIAKGQSWAPAAVSGVLIATAIPAIFLGPVAGVFADRWDRRRIMLTADACRAVLVLAMLPLAWPSVAAHLGRPAELTLAYLLVAAASCFSQFFNPCRFAVVAAVVGQENMAQASGLLMAAMSLAGVIGPPLAAPLLFVSGVQWALIINALSFAASFAAIWLIKLPAAADGAGIPAAGKEPSGLMREFTAGLRFFATSKVLVALALGVVIATLGTGAINALNVFFITHNLHVAAKWYGTMGTADGLGSVLGALATGVIAAKIAPKRIFWGGLVLLGIVFLIYSRMTLLIPALILLALVGVVAGTLNVAISPLLVSVTPQEMMGRVISVINPLQQVANVAATAAAGFLASTVLRNLHQPFAGMTFGPYDTIFGIGALLFVLGGLAAIPLLRSAPDPRPAPAAEPVPVTALPDAGPADEVGG